MGFNTGNIASSKFFFFFPSAMYNNTHHGVVVHLNTGTGVGQNYGNKYGKKTKLLPNMILDCLWHPRWPEFYWERTNISVGWWNPIRLTILHNVLFVFVGQLTTSLVLMPIRLLFPQKLYMPS